MIQKRRKPILNLLLPYAYLSPTLISLSVLSFLPILYTIYIAFTNFSLNHFQSYDFVGLANFREILAGDFKSIFLPVFGWTFVFALLSTLLTYFLGLFLAILLNNSSMRESNLYRAILIIPWGLPGAIAVLAWSGLLNESFGAINIILAELGMAPVPWSTDPFWAKISLVLVNLWLGYPYMMNVCLGGLQAIPNELYEAADIDGASWWKKLRLITIPLLSKSSLPLLISSFAFNFNNFGTAYLVTGGGPPRADTAFAGYTDILVTSAYKMTLTFYRYDMASALSLIIFIIIGTISLINMRVTRAFEEAD